VYCLSEEQQILTNKGFMFCEQVREALRSDLTFRVAQFNPETDMLEFVRVDGIILNKPEEGGQEMLSFTNAAEAERWRDEENTHGFYPEGFVGGSNGMSAVVTPEHDMYVLEGKFEDRDGSGKFNKCKPGAKFSKKRAKDLETTDQKAGAEFLPHATEGLLVPEDERDWGFIWELGLKGDEQVAAFLKFYGFWLGDGSLDFAGGGAYDAVTFNQVKAADKKFLDKQLKILGIEYIYKEITGTGNHPISGEEVIVKGHRYIITEQSYVNYFRAEYQHKYKMHARARNPVKSNYDLEHLPAYAAGDLVDEEEGGDKGFVKSAKWFWSWVWKLRKEEMRYIVEGLHLADGVTGGAEIFTSSIIFRDQLVHLCLLAGYSALFRCRYRAGANMGKDFVATADNWAVKYSDEDEVRPHVHLDESGVQRIQYYSYTWCVTVPSGLIMTRRAMADDKGIVTKASRPVIIGNCFEKGLAMQNSHVAEIRWGARSDVGSLAHVPPRYLLAGRLWSRGRVPHPHFT